MILAVVSLFLFGKNARAEKHFSTNGELISCYQRNFLQSGGGGFNLLKLGGATSFRFDNTNSATLQVHHIRIEVSDGNGGYNDLFDIGGGLTLEDGNFQWVHFPEDIFPIIPIQLNDGNIINTNTFTFGNVASAKLTLFGAFGINHIIQEIDLTFFNSLEEAFTLEPENNSCYLYDPFNLRASTLLDGLCGTSNIKLEPLATNPLISQLASSYDLDLPRELDEFNKSVLVNEAIDVGDHCDGCNWAAPHNAPDPVTCGCTSFTLTFTLMPCNGITAECPPLEMSKEIEICCRCDVRSSIPGH